MLRAVDGGASSNVQIVAEESEPTLAGYPCRLELCCYCSSQQPGANCCLSGNLAVIALNYGFAYISKAFGNAVLLMLCAYTLLLGA